MVGSRPPLLRRVSLRLGIADQRAERTFGFALRSWPIEAVVSAFGTEEAPRVLQAVAVVVGFRVFALGVLGCAQHFDGRDLILADPAIENFLEAGSRIEAPRAFA